MMLFNMPLNRYEFEIRPALQCVCLCVCVPQHLLTQVGPRHGAIGTQRGCSRYNCCTHECTRTHMGIAPVTPPPPTAGEEGSFSHPVVSLSFKFPSVSLRRILLHSHMHQSIKSQPTSIFALPSGKTAQRGECRCQSHLWSKQGQRRASQKSICVSAGNFKVAIIRKHAHTDEHRGFLPFASR